MLGLLGLDLLEGHVAVQVVVVSHVDPSEPALTVAGA